MPTRDWTITFIHRTLDDSVLVTEPLLLPELCCCDSYSSRLRGTVRDLARSLIEQLPASQLHQRIVASEPAVQQVSVTLNPPKRQVDWVEPVALEFGIVRWAHGHDAHRIFVPPLGIEVVARRQAEINKLLTEHILAALRRTKAAESLFQLALLQRDAELNLEPIAITARHKAPKQIEQDLEGDDEPSKKPVIADVGLVLGDPPLQSAYEIDSIAEQIAELLTGRSPRSVLLVGPSGVGKTAAVHEMVRRRDTFGLAGRPVWATSGSRLIAGASGYGVWQQRCQRLCKEAARDGAILHLGNLVELIQVGRAGGSQGIAGFLKTPLGRGDLLAIAECTPEQLALIERQDPHLLELFHQLKVEEPDAAAGLRILRKIAAAMSGPTVLDPDLWLQTLDRLHRRYATYSAAPGRPARFLRNLLKDRQADQSLASAEVIAAFSRETGLPVAMLDPDMLLDLTVARSWFVSRLIGQDRAIDLVIDLLATVKASLTRPRRPIASLLFVGPTGVGKTEMAKALAEYFFGDHNRLTRFDMSEYATLSGVERLIGGAFGSEGLLTAKVREQPFSVILFDEFEKAHAGFFDLLLQVLGEGRLTDAAGRLGDFSNAIVIMTSNLGAESFGRGKFGLARGDGYADPEGHFTDEVRSFVRPELFNRIDRIVPFLPLGAEVILQIARRELSLVEQRDGFRLRGVSMNVSPAACQRLADRGYDIRYGARPLKRSIERNLLAPLAEALNRYPPDVRLEADAVLDEMTELAVTVRAKLDSAGKAISVSASGSDAAAAARACAALRRDVQLLLACPAVLTVTNLLFQLEREQQHKEAKGKAKGKPVYDPIRAERMRELRLILDAVAGLSADVNATEDLALSGIYSGTAIDLTQVRASLSLHQARLDDLLLQLLARQSAKPHRALIGIVGHQRALVPLASAYCSAAKACGYGMDVCWYETHGRSAYKRHRADGPAKLLESPPTELVGIAMMFSGPYASLRFAPEKGVHAVMRNENKWSCLVDAADGSMADYVPPSRESWPTDVPGTSHRRTYDLVACIAMDSVLDKELRWNGKTIETVVSDGIELQLRRAARAVIEA